MHAPEFENESSLNRVFLVMVDCHDSALFGCTVFVHQFVEANNVYM